MRFANYATQIPPLSFEDRVVGDLVVVVTISRFDISEFDQINRFLRCDLTRAFPGLRDSLWPRERGCFWSGVCPHDWCDPHSGVETLQSEIY